jgi:hypothetical protein
MTEQDDQDTRANAAMTKVSVDRVIALAALLQPAWVWWQFHPLQTGPRGMIAFGNAVVGMVLSAVSVWTDQWGEWPRRGQWLSVGWICVSMLLYGWEFQGFYVLGPTLTIGGALLASAVHRHPIWRYTVWALPAIVIQWVIVLPMLKRLPN